MVAISQKKQANKQNQMKNMQSARRHLKLVNVEFHCRNLCILMANRYAFHTLFL